MRLFAPWASLIVLLSGAPSAQGIIRLINRTPGTIDHHVSSECVAVSGDMLLADPRHELVFSGRVATTTRVGELAYRATFDVDRIWKGDVAKHMDIYIWELKSEMPRYEEGKDYVVLAAKATDARERDAIGLKDDTAVAYVANSCSDALAPDIRRQLGQGTRPK